MRKTEIVLFGIFTIATILTLNGVIAFNTTILLVSGLFLSVVYFLFGFLLLNNRSILGIFSKSTYSELKPGYIVMGVLLGIALSSIISPILFKLLLWPGFEFMMLVGLITLIPCILAIIIVQVITGKILFFMNVRFFVWTLFCAVIYLIPLRTVIDARYMPKYPDLAGAMARYYENKSEDNFRLYHEELSKYQDKMIESGK